MYKAEECVMRIFYIILIFWANFLAGEDLGFVYLPNSSAERGKIHHNEFCPFLQMSSGDIQSREDVALRKAGSLQSLYTSLDPTSVAQHLAFYELYPDTLLGKQALRRAWELLQGDKVPESILSLFNPASIISFVNRVPGSSETPLLAEDLIIAIEKLAKHLHNRSLEGFHVWDSKAMEELSPDQIDLSRAIFLSEIQQDTREERTKIRCHETHIDLMALQIKARLGPAASAVEKIRAINDFIFHELEFRFPPRSLYAKDVDVYTLLPSVLDRRRGVCLGVSILYLCLAQRLDLALEAITPPGHIYVRYVNPADNAPVINIETTARGIDIPSEVYLGIETYQLQKRSVKEVVGLALMNKASASWQRKDFATAIRLYEQAKPYLPRDYLLTMFLGCSYLFAGKTEEGKASLEMLKTVDSPYWTGLDSIAQDYLNGKANADAILTVFSEIDEKRSSILEKQEKLKQVEKQWPEFRQGLVHLAITYLQLGREKESLPLLERCDRLDPTDPTISYYLSVIYFQRRHFAKAWRYLQQTEAIVFPRGHHPKALKELRESLQIACPEPSLRVCETIS
jgi:tetratricopeptide (TPR) repeat protein